MEIRFRIVGRGLTLVCQRSKLAIPLSSKSKPAARQTEKLGRLALNQEMGCDAPGGTIALKEVKRQAR